MSAPAPLAPVYIDTFRIDVGKNGVAVITFGSPVPAFADKAPALLPTVSVAMTEDKLTELTETLNRRRKKDAVLRLKSAGVTGESA